MVSAEERAMVEAVATAKGTTVSAIVRETIRREHGKTQASTKR